MNQHFGFISFPDELTTGSSIMPHKKNPDVFELIRAKTNQIQSIPQTISMILTNSTTGYHRDLQLLKEEIFPGLASTKSCVEMSTFMLKDIRIKKDVLNDKFYQHVFSVEVVNDLVLSGMPFRDAYKKVGLDIESGNFAPDQSTVSHSHEGSIGNLCLEKIQGKFDKGIQTFDFSRIDRAVKNLLNPS